MWTIITLAGLSLSFFRADLWFVSDSQVSSRPRKYQAAALDNFGSSGARGRFISCERARNLCSNGYDVVRSIFSVNLLRWVRYSDAGRESIRDVPDRYALMR